MKKNTPDNITKLLKNEIFVFGSNLRGIHAGGAALQAKQSFGAIEGIAEGIAGQSYAFPTLDKYMRAFSNYDQKKYIFNLFRIANRNKDKVFLVTKVGCGIAGVNEHLMHHLFREVSRIYFFKGWSIPKNLVFPEGWTGINDQKDLSNI